MARIWKLKKGEKVSPYDFIPLEKRIEWIILSVFREKGGVARPDDIFKAIFTTLRNADTPENEEIVRVLKRLAIPKKNNKGRCYWQLKNEYREVRIEEFIKPETRPVHEEALRDHDSIMMVLSNIGKKFGLDIWLGETEVLRNQELLSGRTINELNIPGLNDIALDRLKHVDVIWLIRKKIPYALFEVEHTTDIRGGILRMSNILELVPHLNVRLTVVIPDEKVRHFNEVLKESSIKRLLEGRSIYYVTYTELSHILDLVQKGELDREKFFKILRRKDYL